MSELYAFPDMVDLVYTSPNYQESLSGFVLSSGHL